jgi:hypothetical protein
MPERQLPPIRPGGEVYVKLHVEARDESDGTVKVNGGKHGGALWVREAQIVDVVKVPFLIGDRVRIYDLPDGDYRFGVVTGLLRNSTAVLVRLPDDMLITPEEDQVKYDGY